MKCLVFCELLGAGIWAAALRVEREPLLTAEPLSCSPNARFSTIDIEVCFLWLLLWSLYFDGLSGPSYWHCFSDLQWFALVGCVHAAAITGDPSSPRKSQEACLIIPVESSWLRCVPLKQINSFHLFFLAPVKVTMGHHWLTRATCQLSSCT